MKDLALIAGTGGLPRAVLDAVGGAARVYALDGFAPEGVASETFRLERLVPFQDRLLDAGVRRVVFAGAVRRPALDPEAFDPRTAALVPRIAGAMGQGDDAALRVLIALFEEAGLEVCGLADIAPELLPGPGVLAGTVTAEADVARAAEVAAALGPLDLGQGVVVRGGLVLAVETLPGTEAMLDFVARAAPGRGGVLWKAPKPGQDRRIDLPAVGPDTVAQAARAGLAGIAFAAGGTVVIDRAATVAAAEAGGVFLWAR